MAEAEPEMLVRKLVKERKGILGLGFTQFKPGGIIESLTKADGPLSPANITSRLIEHATSLAWNTVSSTAGQALGSRITQRLGGALAQTNHSPTYLVERDSEGRIREIIES